MAQFDEFLKFVRRDVPLAMHTRLQIGGPAEFFAEPTSTAELVALLKQSRLENIPVRMLGSGSNILVPEDGISGVVLSLAAPVFCEVEIENRKVLAGAGTKLGRVITQAVSQGLSGIEGLIGIPGTIGGALCGNAGTNNGDLGEWVANVTVVDPDGNLSVLTKTEISFGFRSSSLDDSVIVSTTLELEPDDPTELARRMQKLWIVRKAQQPSGELASACAFKNPRSGAPAEELIEKAGLKGARIGGAMISERSANFIVLEPEGTFDDVVRLLDLVSEQVEKRTEIELEPAIEIWQNS